MKGTLLSEGDEPRLLSILLQKRMYKQLLPVYVKRENVRDWLFVNDHANAIDVRNNCIFIF